MAGNKNEETYSREEAEEQVRTLGRLFGLMFYHFANILVEEFGEDKGRALVKETVKRFGLDRAEDMRRKAIRMRLEPILENFSRVSDLPEIGWGGPTRETYCPFAEVWIEKGAESLCKLYCDVDIWKMAGFNQKINVRRARWVLEGDSDCRYEMEN